MESIKRRTFLSSSIAAAGALALASDRSQAVAPAQKSRRPNPIAVSTYSFWRFKRGMKMPIEKCIDEAARMGFDGVDLLLYQMESEENSYLQKIKRHALINGLDLCCMSTHQGYVYPDKETLDTKAMEMAKEIASNPPLAVQGTKEVFLFDQEATLDQSLEYNAVRSSMIMPSEDLSEAISAYMEKRKGELKGA